MNVLATRDGFHAIEDAGDHLPYIHYAIPAGVFEEVIDVEADVFDTISAVLCFIFCYAATHGTPKVIAALHDVPNLVGVLALNVVRRLDAANADLGTTGKKGHIASRPKLIESLRTTSMALVDRSLGVDHNKARR